MEREDHYIFSVEWNTEERIIIEWTGVSRDHMRKECWHMLPRVQYGSNFLLKRCSIFMEKNCSHPSQLSPPFTLPQPFRLLIDRGRSNWLISLHWKMNLPSILNKQNKKGGKKDKRKTKTASSSPFSSWAWAWAWASSLTHPHPQLRNPPSSFLQTSLARI